VSVSLLGALPWIYHSYSRGLADGRVLTQAQIAATLLLALPALVATFLAGRREHRLLDRFLRALRLTLLWSALLAYVGAALLAVGPAGSALRIAWLFLSLFAAVLAAIILVALRRARVKYKIPEK
jgi:hypothetical protein